MTTLTATDPRVVEFYNKYHTKVKSRPSLYTNQRNDNNDETYAEISTRVIEACPGEWAVQFGAGLNRWVQLGDTFDSREAAEAFEQEQIDSVDFGDE